MKHGVIREFALSSLFLVPVLILAWGRGLIPGVPYYITGEIWCLGVPIKSFMVTLFSIYAIVSSLVLVYHMLKREHGIIPRGKDTIQSGEGNHTRVTKGTIQELRKDY